MEFIFYTSLFFCNIFMIGVSIVTQFVTYPSFKFIHIKEFSKFHKGYTRKMLFIVGPIMSIEFLSTVVLLYINANLHFFIQFGLVSLIWILTFFLIVPIHNELENQFNNKLNKKLIKFNGIRTLLWIIKLIFLCII